ncbi:MAG: hypothetical protein AB1556_05535 [Bacillota bacterium]
MEDIVYVSCTTILPELKPAGGGWKITILNGKQGKRGEVSKPPLFIFPFSVKVKTGKNFDLKKGNAYADALAENG